MNRSEKFLKVFGIYSEEFWAMPEQEMLEWINGEADDTERTAKVETNWVTYSGKGGLNIVHIPYSHKCGNCGCCLERTYNGRDIHYCPACGYRLEWWNELD